MEKELFFLTPLLAANDMVLFHSELICQAFLFSFYYRNHICQLQVILYSKTCHLATNPGLKSSLKLLRMHPLCRNQVRYEPLQCHKLGSVLLHSQTILKSKDANSCTFCCLTASGKNLLSNYSLNLSHVKAARVHNSLTRRCLRVSHQILVLPYNRYPTYKTF